MVSHHIAMITCENYYRVIELLGILERLEYFSDTVIDHLDHAVGRGDCLPQQLVASETARCYPLALIFRMNGLKVLEVLRRSVQLIGTRRR